MSTEILRQLTDRELLDATRRAAADERRSTLELVDLLSEIDARKLYLGEGCSSLFTYCTGILRLSEHAAYHRIEAARAMRLFPVIADCLRDGSMTLTTVTLLRPHLTLRNHIQLIMAARNKSKREVEYQIACLVPKPGVAALVRRLPDATSSPVHMEADSSGRFDMVARGDSPPATPLEHPPPKAIEPTPAGVPQQTPTWDVTAKPRPKIEPLDHDRYLLRITLSAAGHANLRRAQDLMRHSVPNGDIAVVVERGLALLTNHLEHQKIADTPRPRASPAPTPRSSGSRYLAAAIRRSVWKRDAGRCAFIGPQGRCTETGRLEFHHLVPFARGGPGTVGNVALRCRAHNVYEGELAFEERATAEPGS